MKIAIFGGISPTLMRLSSMVGVGISVVVSFPLATPGCCAIPRWRGAAGSSTNEGPMPSPGGRDLGFNGPDPNPRGHQRDSATDRS